MFDVVVSGLDMKSDACQHFMKEGMVISYNKILLDDAVSTWKFEIHVSEILYFTCNINTFAVEVVGMFTSLEQNSLNMLNENNRAIVTTKYNFAVQLLDILVFNQAATFLSMHPYMDGCVTSKMMVGGGVVEPWTLTSISK